FSAALATIEPNFPPGVVQGDPRFTHLYFNMSNGEDVRGPWNEGQGPWPEGEEWVYVNDPVEQVVETKGQSSTQPEGTTTTQKEADKLSKQVSTQRTKEVMSAMKKGENQWSSYSSTSGSK